MTREELFDRATDPRQYDAPDLDWPREGSRSTPSMEFFRHYLFHELGTIRGRSVVDIGCGTGHLYDPLRALGAGRVVGLEPSARNAAIARREQPGLEVIESALQDAELDSRFDVAVAVMSFEHQPDLEAAFRHVAGLLEPAGKFLLIAGDIEFHLSPRFGLRLEVHRMPDGSALVATGYGYGTLHDVIRPLAHYRDAARATGFRIQSVTPMVPTAVLVESDPRWAEFAGRPVAHLQVMER